MEHRVTTAEQPRYFLLGPVKARDENGPVPLGAPKQRAVLAVLLLHANRVVAEERFFDLIWGEQQPPSVRMRLRVYISELRLLFGQDAIERAGSGYSFRVAPGQLDLDVFADTVAAAQADLRAQRPDAAARRLRSALALWTGPALGGVSESLAEHQRPGLEERRLAALEDLFEAELAAGRHAEVVGELREAVADHPFRSRLTTQLMLALHRCGRNPEALGVYAQARRTLVDELGIEPSQEMRNMQQRILNSDGGSALPVEPDDLLLGDSAEKVRDQPAELPRDAHGFVGRDDALAALNAHMAEAGGSVALVTGAAGVGKTALAVRWAHTVRTRFPDGQLYVNLRGYEADDEPLPAVAALGQLLRSLGVPARLLPDTLDERLARYRSLLADKQFLILLDNARDATQVLPLLPPSGFVVVTSRHRLSSLVAHTGAKAISLSRLSADEARELLVTMLGMDRVVAEAESAAVLTRLCDGLPLALRIAAANVAICREGTIEAVVGALTKGDRLAALAIDGEEKSVVAAAFGASYQALEPGTRRLFRLLGLLPGPDFTAPAAAAVAGIPVTEATRRLEALAAVHLVEAHVPGRFRFHDLIRWYAVGLARADDERASAWARVVDYYLSLAIWTTNMPAVWAAALPEDGSDQALVLAEPPSPLAGATDLLALEAIRFNHGLLTAAEDPLTPAKDVFGEFGTTIGLAFAHLWLSRLHRQVDNHQRTYAAASSALALARQGGGTLVAVAALIALGDAEIGLERYSAAQEHIELAIRVAGADGYRWHMAYAFCSLARLYMRRDDHVKAVAYARQACDVARETGHHLPAAAALTTLCEAYLKSGRTDLARTTASEAIAICQQTGQVDEERQINDLLLEGACFDHLRDSCVLPPARNG